MKVHEIRAGQTFFKRTCREITVLAEVGNTLLMGVQNDRFRTMIVIRWPDMLIKPHEFVLLLNAIEEELNASLTERYYVMSFGGDVFTARLGWDFSSVLHLELFAAFDVVKTFYSPTGYQSWFGGLISLEGMNAYFSQGKNYIEEWLLQRFPAYQNTGKHLQLSLFAA